MNKLYCICVGAIHQINTFDHIGTYYKLKPCERLYVIIDSDPHQSNMLIDYVKKLGYRFIVVKSFTYLSIDKHIRNIKNQLYYFTAKSNLVIKYFYCHHGNAPEQLIAGILKPKKIYYFDEGTAVFKYICSEKSKFKTKIIRFLKTKLNHNLYFDENNVAIITKFNISQFYRKRFFHYQCQKKVNTEKPISDNVLFLGDTLVESKLVKEKCYLDLLKKFMLHFQNCRIIYYPHRKESEKKASKIIDFVDNYLPHYSPIETELKNWSQWPSKIISFSHSGVLINISDSLLHYPDLVYLHLPAKIILKDYEYFQRFGHYLKNTITTKKIQMLQLNT